VVFEDATSGVEAGVAGGFALVVGVDRTGSAEALRSAGAHLVVEKLTEIMP
jgi:beta-phosphoglucomutase-like phosphatase (HAD superfamily)